MNPKVYVASSWRCVRQPEVVHRLREVYWDVYDFRNPGKTNGFHWSEVAINSDGESAEAYLHGLKTERAFEAFSADFLAMQEADACVLVLPCGRSAHLELGWCVGQNKRTAILLDDDPVTPELMYMMADFITTSIEELITRL